MSKKSEAYEHGKRDGERERRADRKHAEKMADVFDKERSEYKDFGKDTYPGDYREGYADGARGR